MISCDVARQLLDFQGKNQAIADSVAEEQLRGSVAVHNILSASNVAYLADEVGMGKTYVALGTIALFRHFDPGFRVLFIAPRENIQRKWMKELRNFTRSNLRFADLRVKAAHGVPAREAVACHSLVELAREASINPDRDFFVRLTSFSLALGGEGDAWKRRRKEILDLLPWLPQETFDLRDRQGFKDAIARALCVALPRFDLVVVDEGHNLKHGFGERVAARNRALALALGRDDEPGRAFKGYGPRARKVLFLSATPVENDYRQLWNQLDVLGVGKGWEALKDPALPDEQKRQIAREFLIRRVTSLDLAGERLTKNLYRREWRRGGVTSHDEPLEFPGEKQRLVVALVQKKVSELLGHERFGNSFQIGMLASFESFLETAKVKKKDEQDDPGNFDDPDQGGTDLERTGIDVASVNRLARSYERTFGQPLPHPKMDALVAELAGRFESGGKALVFVRRVASVRELQSRLQVRYDAMLRSRLQDELGESLWREMARQFQKYEEEKAERRRPRPEPVGDSGVLEEGYEAEVVTSKADVDPGGTETFFSWFFRGDGPPGVLSGASLQRRLTQASSAVSTLFEDNHVAWLLGARPNEASGKLAAHLGWPVDQLGNALREEMPYWLPAGTTAKKVGRLHLFSAAQAAGLRLLEEQGGDLADLAGVLLRALGYARCPNVRGVSLPEGAERRLDESTVFTELRESRDLCMELWPLAYEALEGGVDLDGSLRRRELQRMMLGAAARLGHSFIDLYVLAARRLGSLSKGVRAVEDEETGAGLAADFVAEMELQRTGGRPGFRSYRELRDVGQHFDLIASVNAVDLASGSVAEAVRPLGTLFGRQQPVGGMFGQINQTLIRQFRLPGYPLILVTTDLLQEGEDLHTFCSTIYHYGISWMPSSMEQRVGRIDRVNSETDRRLRGSAQRPEGRELLQVHYPHLGETVEKLQVDRVLERMNRFLRLMHENLGRPEGDTRHLDVAAEIQRIHRDVEQIREPLTSAFEIDEGLLQGPKGELAVPPEQAERLLKRFLELKDEQRMGGVEVRWEANLFDGALVGSARLGDRGQPFTLLLRSIAGRPLVRCVSPIGRWSDEDDLEGLREAARTKPIQISILEDERDETKTVSAEAEVLLKPTGSRFDAPRVGGLVERVTRAADELESILFRDAQDGAVVDFENELQREAQPDE